MNISLIFNGINSCETKHKIDVTNSDIFFSVAIIKGDRISWQE